MEASQIPNLFTKKDDKNIAEIKSVVQNEMQIPPYNIIGLGFGYETMQQNFMHKLIDIAKHFIFFLFFLNLILILEEQKH